MSEINILLGITLPLSSFFAEPKTLVIHSASSLAFACTAALYFLDNNVLILPFNELPGTIGLLVLISFITGESTAPIAENAEEPPICMPVTTSNTPFI